MDRKKDDIGPRIVVYVFFACLIIIMIAGTAKIVSEWF